MKLDEDHTYKILTTGYSFSEVCNIIYAEYKKQYAWYSRVWHFLKVHITLTYHISDKWIAHRNKIIRQCGWDTEKFYDIAFDLTSEGRAHFHNRFYTNFAILYGYKLGH